MLRLRGDGGNDNGERSSRKSAGGDDDRYEALPAIRGVGEHIVYHVAEPVSIRAREAAVVPVAQYILQGEQVLVYDYKDNEVNAVRSFLVKNDTPVVLAPGSICLLEGGRFLGQVCIGKKGK